MAYNYDAWKNYKEVPRFIKEYARYKINLLTDNEYLNPDYVDKAVGNIFKAIERTEYRFISIDECVSIIETTAFNID